MIPLFYKDVQMTILHVGCKQQSNIWLVESTVKARCRIFPFINLGIGLHTTVEMEKDKPNLVTAIRDEWSVASLVQNVPLLGTTVYTWGRKMNGKVCSALFGWLAWHGVTKSQKVD